MKNGNGTVGPDIWILDKTPCGKTVYTAEISEWQEGKSPDPLTGESIPRQRIHLTPIWKGDDITHFVGAAPSGAFLKLWND